MPPNEKRRRDEGRSFFFNTDLVLNGLLQVYLFPRLNRTRCLEDGLRLAFFIAATTATTAFPKAK